MMGRAFFSRFVDKPLFHMALIAILGLLAYSNTFGVPFQWDEHNFIVNNPIVKDLSFFLHPSKASGLQYYGALNSRYVGYLTFALNYKIHGLDVTGYHVVNIAIHLINAVLVYWFIVLTFRTPFFANRKEIASPSARNDNLGDAVIARSEATKQSNYIALFTALLFVAHPIQTEAVTYIFQRLASLAAMLYLASMVFYAAWRLKTEQQSSNKAVQRERKNHCATAPLLWFNSNCPFVAGPRHRPVAN
jgi:hypothetical protein